MEYQNDNYSSNYASAGNAGFRIIQFPVNGGIMQDKPGRVITGYPGETLPNSIPDFRPYLQRNGLILLSWCKRTGRIGTYFTAYWVTSSDTLRYYASKPLHIEDFMDAMPHRKSYAAEDGIDYYGEANPVYIVHVAPELMMSNPEKINERPLHIKKLMDMGIESDFSYSYILTKEKRLRRKNGIIRQLS